MRNKTAWAWYASGKHPIFRDFFKMGSNDAVLKAFADWADAGFQQLVSGRGQVAIRGDYSWRFWSRGPKKGFVICGVGRDSCDTLGRPHPLMIVGSGPLIGWESNWDLLPLALDDIWSQLEYLGCGRVKNFRQLEDGFRRIKQPSSDWPALANRHGMTGAVIADNNHVGLDSQDVATHAQRLLETGEIIINLNNAPGTDSDKSADHWIGTLKAHLKFVPNTVFLGGMPDKSFLIALNRPLSAADFARIWTIGAQ